MKTLLLSQGDLVIAPHGHATITGSPKIRQDLALALGEALGHDRFHPEWGSVLARYVGKPITAEVDLAVKAEVNRVMGVYIEKQRIAIENDSIRSRRSRMSLADVVRRVVHIQTEINADTIKVFLVLETMSRERVTISRTVGY